VISVIPVQILFCYLYFNNVGDRPLETNAFLVITLAKISILLLFYGLTTFITADKIGPIIWSWNHQKKIQISRIKSVEAIRNPWYYGWGIRFIPKGVLFNIGGRDGVELRFKDTSRVIRIGTREPLRVTQAIEKRLQLK